MARRFYLSTNDDNPSGLTVAFDASWESTVSAIRGRMKTIDRNSAFVTTAVAETSASGTFDVLLRQYVSDPFDAITISGTVKGIIRSLESAADADMRAQLVLRVVSFDGATVRGTLIASDASALSNEFDAATLTNRKFPLNWAGAGTAVSSVAAQKGDRLVLEIGYRAHNVTATSKTGSLRFGEASASDLAENETGTTDDNPWFEISDDLIFLTESGSVDRRGEAGHSEMGTGRKIRPYDGSGFYKTSSGLPTTPVLGGFRLAGGAQQLATVQVNDVAPLISGFSPAVASTILRTAHISFNVTDDINELSRVVIVAKHGSGETEVIWDGDAFVDSYTSSVRTPISLGYSFDLVRTGGWPHTGLTLRIIARDENGNEATPLQYSWTVSNPPGAPVISNFSPAVLSTISRTDSIAFDFTDDGTVVRVVVMVEYTGGFSEVIWDGDAFTPTFSPGSSRSSISGGYHFALLRAGLGWPYIGLTLRIIGSDNDNNEATPLNYAFTVSDPLSSDDLFLMRAQDLDCGAVVYREWIVLGTPDYTASQYVGPRCGATPLAEITATKLSC